MELVAHLIHKQQLVEAAVQEEAAIQPMMQKVVDLAVVDQVLAYMTTIEAVVQVHLDKEPLVEMEEEFQMDQITEVILGLEVAVEEKVLLEPL
jgi:hypothetical protein